MSSNLALIVVLTSVIHVAALVVMIWIRVRRTEGDGIPVASSPGFEFMLQLQHRQSDHARLRARQADHPNAAPTRGRGDSDDSVVRVHGEIVSGER